MLYLLKMFARPLLFLHSKEAYSLPSMGSIYIHIKHHAYMEREKDRYQASSNWCFHQTYILYRCQSYVPKPVLKHGQPIAHFYQPHGENG